MKEAIKGITTTDFILEMMSENKKNAIKMFKDFHIEEEKKYFNISDGKRKTEEEVRKIIFELNDGKEPHEIGRLTKTERNEMLALLKSIEGISIRQIERATGIPRGIIQRM